MKKNLFKPFQNKFFFITIFFIILSFSIISIWFRSGFIYGGGDVGLQTFNPQRILSISLYPWWEAVAPGLLIPLSVTNIPFEFGLSILQTLGFSNLSLQAITFFLLLFLMGFGMYLFLFSLFNKDKQLSLLGALFYLFNPYMLIQIWHRFVHTSIFFVAALPYLFIFWRKWIKEGKVKYLLVFLLINLFASYMFGTLAFIATLWLFLFLFIFLESILPFSNKRLFLIQGARFMVGLVSWVLTSTWWLIPFIVGSSQYSQQYNQSDNLSSLILISKQAILPFSLQLINPFNLYQQLDFGAIYNTFIFKLIPWLSVIVVFIGLLRSLKEKGFAVFGLLTIILIFLAKGSSAPLGELFVWGFKNFFFIGVLRNPSEKIGILLPFVYTVLFVLGFVFIKDRLKSLGKNVSNVLWIVVLLPNLIFCWPLFTGQLFGSINSPATIKVPQSYQAVDDFISNEIPQDTIEDQGRILHLPLSVSEAVTYNWEAGYSGVEPNILLFNSLPSISRNLNLPKFDDALKGLAFTFMYPYSDSKDAILKALQSYNVKFIILHKDANFLADGIINPEEEEKVLDNLPFLKKIYTAGQLSVYKLEDEYFQPKIILSENPNYIRSGENNNVWLFQAENKRNLISEVFDNQVTDNMQQYLLGTTIFADKSFRFYQASPSAVLSDAFHNDVVNKLNTVKLRLQAFAGGGGSDLIEQLLYENQLLKDFVRRKDYQISTLNSYEDSVRKLLEDPKAFSKLQFLLNNSILQPYFNNIISQQIFQEQLLLLDQLKEISDNSGRELIDSISNKVVGLLINDGIFPRSFNLNEIKLGINRQVFYLSLPYSSDYEIFMTKAFDPKIFDNNLAKILFLIDGKAIDLDSTIDSQTLSFGKYKLEEGVHEISYPVIYSKNLLDPKDVKPSQGKIENDIANLETTTNASSFFEIPFNGVEGGGLYHFNIDVNFPRGRNFYLQLLQDSDPLNSNKEPTMQINENITKEGIGEGWRNINFDTNLRMTTKNAKIRILLSPDTSILGTGSSLGIRNLSVQKVLNNTIFLKTEGDLNKEGLDTEITPLVHPNPVSYSGEIDVKKPSFLILKETYNPNWVLSIKNGDSAEKINNHLIGDLYGNAWFIEKPGKYSFEIKLESIKYNVLGFWLSLFSYLFLILIFCWVKIRR